MKTKPIKYRAQSIFNHEWWEGYYIYSKYTNSHFIVQDAVRLDKPNGSMAFAHFAQVDPKTLTECK